MVICPYCRQDCVWEVNIRDHQGSVYMCLECDTVWLASDEISDQKGLNYEDFMVQRGLNADWNAIAKIKPVNEIL